MGIEIERKFLVRDDSWRLGAAGVPVRQGYVSVSALCSVRVRTLGDRAFLTVKSAADSLVVRAEFEYPIPMEDARAMLDTLCGSRIVEKTRYRIVHRDHVWEVDEFHGMNTGLLIAEIELGRVDEPFDLPPWVGDDVSHESRYLNSFLSEHPYTTW